MALFLEMHKLDGRDPEALVQQRHERAAPAVHILKHWVGQHRLHLALLVQAPDANTLQADNDAEEITELFSPAERWTSCDAADLHLL